MRTAREAEVLLVGAQAEGGGEPPEADRVLRPEAGGTGRGSHVSALPGLADGECGSQAERLARHQDLARRGQSPGVVLPPLFGAELQLMGHIPGVEKDARRQAAGARPALCAAAEPAAVRDSRLVDFAGPLLRAPGCVPQRAVDAF